MTRQETLKEIREGKEKTPPKVDMAMVGIFLLIEAQLEKLNQNILSFLATRR